MVGCYSFRAVLECCCQLSIFPTLGMIVISTRNDFAYVFFLYSTVFSLLNCSLFFVPLSVCVLRLVEAMLMVSMLFELYLVWVLSVVLRMVSYLLG